jgi:hypothetical protein
LGWIAITDRAHVEQPLDQQTIRTFDRDQRHPELEQSRAQRSDPVLVVAVSTPLNDPSVSIHDADRVLLASPIDTSKPANRPSDMRTTPFDDDY